MTMTVVVGSPKAGSRTLRVVTAVADALRESDETAADLLIVHLAEVASELFDFESTVVKGLLDSVANSDLVVVASPTHQATYTGLLKSFLDRYGNDGVADAVCIPILTGAAPIHALAPEVHLRPLLVELGASTPTRGLFVTEQEFHDLDTVIASWARAARPLVDRALRGRSPASSAGR
jgi:FMN reductase